MFFTNKKFWERLLISILILIIFIKFDRVVLSALNWLLDSVPFLENIISFLGKVLFFNYFCLFSNILGLREPIEVVGVGPLFFVLTLVIIVLLFSIIKRIYLLLSRKYGKWVASIVIILLIIIYFLLVYFLIPCK